MTRRQSLAGALHMVLLTGSALLATIALGQEGERLPTGVTLLRTDDTPCNGELVLSAGIRGGDDDVNRVRPGEYASFEVENENVAWMCLGESTSSDTMECPSGTTHLRILRRADDDVMLFECYGRADEED